MPGTIVVIPCYDEAGRLSLPAFAELLAGGVDLLFVDDGSRDATLSLLSAYAATQPERVRVLPLPRNQGKAEAVRQGMRAALEHGADIVGYLDADLATPPAELLRILETLQRTGAAVAIGSRVAMLGSTINRRPLRHYLGRIYATAASLLLRVAVYDTQCGAKLFRRGAALSAALAEPFSSRWGFDVELLGRLLTGAPQNPEIPAIRPADMVEVPLREWRDVAGSKLRPGAMLRAATDLVRVGARLAERRRPCGPGKGGDGRSG